MSALNLLLAGLLEEAIQRVLRVQQPQVNPQQPIQPGDLKVLERHDATSSLPVCFSSPAICCNSRQRVSQRHEPIEQLLGQRGRDSLERLLRRHRRRRPRLLRLLRFDVA